MCILKSLSHRHLWRFIIKLGLFPGAPGSPLRFDCLKLTFRDSWPVTRGPLGELGELGELGIFAVSLELGLFCIFSPLDEWWANSSCEVYFVVKSYVSLCCTWS
jgi:hypothetical protein